MRMIDQIRAHKLPSNLMQFAAKGALSVPPAENIEILVYLARFNPVFGATARMTLAGWDEKSCLVAASDPQTDRDVLDYFISPDNLRPALLPALLGNSSLADDRLLKFALSATHESIVAMMKSPRVLALPAVLDALLSNPYTNKEEADEIRKLLQPAKLEPTPPAAEPTPHTEAATEASEVPDEEVSAYLAEHAAEIAAEGDKPFQAIGGIVELLGQDYFPVHEVAETTTAPAPAAPSASAAKKAPEGKRDNAVQKINRLDIKGRIQLALKGNKEERSLLIRDGTKVVALAVLEAPKLSDGEVEKFASQKNVLESVLRQIPLKRRFMKNYIVVRNLVANPRTPLDLGLTLMKNLLINDLKNISGNKEVSETIRKLALKMYKQKLDAANKK